MGLAVDDREFIHCLREAAVFSNSQQMRRLFVTILLHGSPLDPAQLFRANVEVKF